jgi:hypothetical protein
MMDLKHRIEVKKNLLSWVVFSGLILGFLFLLDLLFIEDTILTPYQEFHPSSKPIWDENAGIAYRLDLKTGKAYVIDERGKLSHFDRKTGELKPAGSEAKNWIIIPEGLIYQHPPISPFYAFYLPTFSIKIILPLFLVFLFLLLFERIRARPDGPKIGTAIIFLILSVILIRAFFAWVGHGLAEMGTEFLVYENEDVIFDVPRVGNVCDFLRDYPERMPALSLHGSHFPPGYVLFLKGISSLCGYSDMASIKAHIGIFGWIVLILGSTAVIPLYLIVRKLFNPESAMVGGVIFALVPNSVIFGAVSMDALFAASALWPVWFFLKAMDQKSNYFYSFFAGIFLAFSTFLSFSGLTLGLFLLLLMLLRMRKSKERILQCLRLAGLTLLGFASVVFFLWFAFKFNFLETFLKARELEAQLMDKAATYVHAKSPSKLWLYTTWGNLLAFALFTGFPIVGIWLRSVKRDIRAKLRKAKSSSSFPLATIALILISGISGIYHMETERIWLYVTAFVVIAAAGELSSLRAFPKRIFYSICTLLILQTALTESLLFTIW